MSRDEKIALDDNARLPASARALTAARIRSEAEESKLTGAGDMPQDRAYAKKLEASTQSKPLVADVGAGGEIVPRAGMLKKEMARVNTVASPTYMAVEASRSRLELADQCGVLDTALDLCDTFQTQDSAERMAACQMALLHRLTMKTGARALETVQRLEGIVQTKDREQATVQLNRLTNSVARSSAEFQNCLLTLHKVRSGGGQSITVTHIQNTQVNDGGQAVVTSGPVGAGGQRVGGDM
jgi:hypothetical protein